MPNKLNPKKGSKRNDRHTVVQYVLALVPFTTHIFLLKAVQGIVVPLSMYIFFPQ